MRIIMDMFDTAKKAKAINDNIDRAKVQITDHERELEELQWGPYAYNLEA